MRPIRRVVLAVAVVLLGAVSASRMSISYLPVRTAPELRVRLSLATDTEPADVTRQYLVPIESALRALGGVVAMRGEVDARGLMLRARLTPLSDVERKCAGMLASVSTLRAVLPVGAALTVWPAGSGGDQPVALIAAVGTQRAASCETTATALRKISGVRDVQSFGCPEPMTRVLVTGGAAVPPTRIEQIKQTILRSTAVRRLGVWHDGSDDSFVPVLVARHDVDDLNTLPVAIGTEVVPLGSVARIVHSRREPESLAMVDGERATLFEVFKDHDVGVLKVDRQLREHLAQLRQNDAGDLRIVWSDAEPVTRLLHVLSLSLILAVGSMAVFGWLLAGVGAGLQAGVAPVLAVAAALNLMWLAKAQLDVINLVAMALAIALTAPTTLLRLVFPALSLAETLTPVATAALMPIAVTLATGQLGASLAIPASTFFLAVCGAVLSNLLLAPLSIPARGASEVFRPKSPRRTRYDLGRWLRPTLREPAIVLLATISVSYLFFTLFGTTLAPHTGRISSDPGRLIVRLSLPEGATLVELEQQLRTVERALAELGAVDQRWSWAHAGEAVSTARLSAEFRTRAARRKVATRLQYQLGGIAAAVRIDNSESTGGFSFSDEFEDRVEADTDGGVYRVLLRSTEVAPLIASYEQVRDRVVASRLPAAVLPRWGAPSVRIHVQSTPALGLDGMRALAAQLGRSSQEPSPSALPGREHRLLVVTSDDRSDEPVTVPLRLDLLARVDRSTIFQASSAPAALHLSSLERVVYSDLSRQSGRFVLPIDIRVPGWRSEDRRDNRRGIDRALDGLSLPSGADLERPLLLQTALERLLRDRDLLRLYALLALLPVLLLVTAAIRLDSLTAGFAAVLPAVVGLAMVTPMLWQRGTSADELALLAIAAALCGTLPTSLCVLSRISVLSRIRQHAGSSIIGFAGRAHARRAPGFAVYRSARALTPAVIFAALGLVVVLAGATVGRDTADDAWLIPLRVAAVVGSACLLASVFVLGPLAVLALEWRRWDPSERARRRDPPAWRDTIEPLTLDVRGLGKRYGGGQWALRDVSVCLCPGVVGLLGPNGAGKTTFIRCLTGLLRPTRGTIRFRGVALEAANLSTFRRHLGFLPQELNAYPGFTGEDFLNYWAHELGLTSGATLDAEITRLLQEVDLADAATRKVRDYSGGMRQRIGIARALLGTPDLLIVDEPTTGLDVAARNRFREVLLRIAAERLVILSTHIASDVEATAARLLVLASGKLRFDGPPAALVTRARGRVFECMVSDADLRSFTRLHRVTKRVRVLEGIRVRAVAPVGISPPGDEVEPTLEEAYLAEMDEKSDSRRDSLSFLGSRETLRMSHQDPSRLA